MSAKVLAILLTVCMAAMLALGGSLAYGQSPCVGFEDQPLGMMYHVGDTFIDSGTPIWGRPFMWSNSLLTYEGFARVGNEGLASGSGQEMAINNVNLTFEFPAPLTGLSLRFGEYGGNLNIELNGDFRNFDDFADIDGTTIGGVTVCVTNGFGDDMGILELRGRIDTPFTIGGQELWIDDVCPWMEELEIYFADGGETLGSVYRYDTATGGVTVIYTRPSQRLYSFAFAPWAPHILYFVNANDTKIFKKDLSVSPSSEVVVYTHSTYVRDVAVTNDGALFFSEATGAGADGRIWRLEGDGTTTLYYTVSLPTVGGFWRGDFTFDPDGFLYLSNGNKVPASIYRVDVATNAVAQVFTDSLGAIAGMAFGKDGLLYYADWGTRIYGLNVETLCRYVVYDDQRRTWLSDVAFREPETAPVAAKGTWVMPYGVGGTSLERIDALGLTDYGSVVDAPFGGYLGFRHGAASSIPTPDITYYRWLYSHENETGWHEFTRPVVVHYVKEVPGLPPSFPTLRLGPDVVNGMNLYQFKPHTAPAVPGATTYWPTSGFLGDIYSGFLDTEGAHLAPGRYKIRLEIYNSAGSQVFPGPMSFRFVVPIGTDSDGTILTEEAQIVRPGSVIAGGFEFSLHIDNRPCNASIDEPTIGLVGAGDCGFLRYDPYDPTPVHVAFHATHPDNFALFSFKIVRGPHVVGVTTVSYEEVSAFSAGVSGAYAPYSGDGLGNFEREFSREELLGPCEPEAAFSANLYVYAKATTGWGYRISKLDASAVRAFALTPE